VPPWDEAEVAAKVARVQAVIEAGGRAFAAWDGARLVGIGTLDVAGIGGSRAVLTLDMLHVSAAYRGFGIARKLTALVADAARARGARALYISATRSQRTVDVYRHMGAVVLAAPDPLMFAREPEDIHLILSLA